MNACAIPVMQIRSSAGLYGADRMVLALNRAVNMSSGSEGVLSRLLCINNYRMEFQALHQAALSQGQSTTLVPCRGRLDPGTAGSLAAIVTREHARVLHVHDYKSAFYAWVASRSQPLALVATLHGQVGTSRSLRLYNRLELALLRRFDLLVAVSGPQVEALRRCGIAPHRIRQIDNGIDPPQTVPPPSRALQSEFGLGGECFVFGAVARLSPEKNLGMLVEAFASIGHDPRARLLLVGDGPERPALEALVAAKGLEKQVRFTGVRPDMERIYPLLDCLVLPSLTEGMPLVVLEAMAHALPVIASAVGDVPRLLAHTDHGRVVPAGNESVLLAAMGAVLRAPRTRDHRARDYVLARHSSKAMADDYLEIYRSLSAAPHVHQSA